MKYVFGGHDTGMTVTGVFGSIPREHVEAVTFARLQEMRNDLFRRSETAAGADTEAKTDEHTMSIQTYRSEVGAMWLKLSHAIDSDIAKAYAVGDNLWKCMWFSIRRLLKPCKYYADCGRLAQGYGGFVTFLANLAVSEETLHAWGFESMPEYTRALQRTKIGLREKEAEYRYAAVAVTQIGIGFGGMLLGLVAFALSLMLTLMG